MNLSLPALSACVSGRWQLSIGDPDVLGWSVFGLYILAGVLAVAALTRGAFPESHRRRDQTLWALIAALMIAVGLNKQLDLQSLANAVGHCLSQAQGWYEDRRVAQRDFILLLALLSCAGAALLIWMLKGRVRANLLPLAGLAALVGFVLVRGMHLLHLFVTEEGLADVAVHSLTETLEILSPALITLAAWRLLRRRQARG
ncbi:MAG: hypothetical protein HC844_03365 [Tabrizicola sp.]|nr:hypothetical protein [Tabrizicola sp.]